MKKPPNDELINAAIKQPLNGKKQTEYARVFAITERMYGRAIKPRRQK